MTVRYTLKPKWLLMIVMLMVIMMNMMMMMIVNIVTLMIMMMMLKVSRCNPTGNATTEARDSVAPLPTEAIPG